MPLLQQVLALLTALLKQKQQGGGACSGRPRCVLMTVQAQPLQNGTSYTY